MTLTIRPMAVLALAGVYSNGYGQARIAERYDLGVEAFPADDLALLRLDTPIAHAPTLGLLATALLPGVPPAPLAARSRSRPAGQGASLP
jgi:hypothetical protein